MIDTVLIGDCRKTLAEVAMTEHKAQVVVTSPPYWALRDYGTGVWEGGDAACDHTVPHTYNTGFNERWGNSAGQAKQEQQGKRQYARQCPRCMAVRVDQQIGLEDTPEEYVETMVEIFRLVRRCMVDGGTLWLNLGDTYAGGGRGPGGAKQQTNAGSVGLGKLGVPTGLKRKDLVGIPWRVAFALQADGWWLRQCIVWEKPNVMPEPIHDRPTTAHEFIFLLSNADTYYYDKDAIREPVTGNAHSRGNGINKKSVPHRGGLGRVKANDSWHASTSEYHESPDGMRNARSVWTIPTAKFDEAHFATFPPEIPKRAILAGSRPGDLVLDPFMGSGTTAMVAQDLGRRWIGCELNPLYAGFVTARARQMGLAL